MTDLKHKVVPVPSVKDLLQDLSDVSRSITVIERLRSEVFSATGVIGGSDTTRIILSLLDVPLSTYLAKRKYLLQNLKENDASASLLERSLVE